MGAVCSRHPWMRNPHELTSMSSRTVSRSACQESLRLLWIQLFISGSQDSATGLYSEPAESSVHTPCSLQMHVDTAFQSMCTFPEYFLSFRFNLCTQFSSASVRDSFHAHLIVHYFIVVIMCGEVKSWNFSIFRFLYSRFTSCLICQNILLGTLFSNMFFL
jgi:hypothetical protein